MRESRKAQIAMEYLILTAFILAAVAIIFTFSFVNYNQNMRTAKATEALAKLANAVDDVYIRGEGNTRFVPISLPDGLVDVEIVHKCGYPPPNQGSLDPLRPPQCTEEGSSTPSTSYDDISFSAIAMTVKLLGGDTVIMRETKAKILDLARENGGMGATTGGLNDYSGSAYTVKVAWTGDGEKIMLKKV